MQGKDDDDSEDDEDQEDDDEDADEEDGNWSSFHQGVHLLALVCFGNSLCKVVSSGC